MLPDRTFRPAKGGIARGANLLDFNAKVLDDIMPSVEHLSVSVLASQMERSLAQ